MRDRLLIMLLPLATACAAPVYAGNAYTPHTTPPRILAALEQTPCFGRCPVYRATVWTDGRVELDGRAHVPHIGVSEYTVEAETLRAIEAAITRADVTSLADSYENHSITDLPTTITTVRQPDGAAREIRRYHGDRTAPPRLVMLEEDLARLMGVDEWLADGPVAWIEPAAGELTITWCHLHPTWLPHQHVYGGWAWVPVGWGHGHEGHGHGGRGHDGHARRDDGDGRGRDGHGRDGHGRDGHGGDAHGDRGGSDQGPAGRNNGLVPGDDGRPAPRTDRAPQPTHTAPMLPGRPVLQPGSDGRPVPSAARDPQPGERVRMVPLPAPAMRPGDDGRAKAAAAERPVSLTTAPNRALPASNERRPEASSGDARRAPAAASTPIAGPRPTVPQRAAPPAPSAPPVSRRPSPWSPARPPQAGAPRPMLPVAGARPARPTSTPMRAVGLSATQGKTLALPQPTPTKKSSVNDDAKKEEVRGLPRKSVKSPVIRR